MPRYRFTGEAPEVLWHQSLRLEPGQEFEHPAEIDHPRVERLKAAKPKPETSEETA